MHLTDLLTADRVAVERPNGATSSAPAFDKPQSLTVLARLLSQGTKVPARDIERVLADREALQSTGIGEGVAIPHGALAQLDTQCAALLIVPDGVEFAAIDGMKVNILFAVIGPKRATGEHLKTLARVSRLLRNKSFRDRLISSANASTAYDLIANEEGGERGGGDKR
jgi:PTS system nitrogen regulatory IIA component